MPSLGTEKCRIKNNPSTDEAGLQIKMINKTGAPSVKGNLVACSTATDKGFILQANEYDTIGVVDEAGVADGQEAWIWLNGRVQVLFKDTVAATRGNILLAGDTDGRAIDAPNPGGGLPGTDTHFKECGHVNESKSAGTNVLVLCTIHFN
jgi:hypothetical protein